MVFALGVICRAPEDGRGRRAAYDIRRSRARSQTTRQQTRFRRRYLTWRVRWLRAWRAQASSGAWQAGACAAFRLNKGIAARRYISRYKTNIARALQTSAHVLAHQSPLGVSSAWRCCYFRPRLRLRCAITGGKPPVLRSTDK